MLQRLACLGFKPEAFAGRRVDTAVAYMVAHGFEPILARRYRLSPLQSREIWRYQWNVATLGRMAVWDAMQYLGNSALVLFRDTEEPLPVPATVRLRG